MTLRLPLLQERTKALETCGYCPKLCRAACPVSAADRRDTVTPWGKMSLSWMAARGDVEPDADIASVAWACTGCMACKQVCDHDNPVAETLAEARADLFSVGLAPSAAMAAASGFAAKAAEARAAAQSLQAADANSSSVLLVGCGYLRRAPEVARDALAATRALIGPVRVASECCGLPLLQAGDRQGFAEQRQRLTRELAGAERVVVHDPGCARVLRDHAPVTLVELGARALSRLGRVEALAKQSHVRWHDPCHLGRGLGLYDAPRAVLTCALGRAPEEFSRRREDATCSGAGGLLPQTMPETSRRIAEARLEDHRSLGSGTLVTACAGSLRRFSSGGAEVVDLATVLARSIESGNGG